MAKQLKEEELKNIQALNQKFVNTKVAIADAEVNKKNLILALETIQQEFADMEKELDCVICGEPIEEQANGWKHGHNAQPVAEGQCCDVCNTHEVIPARVAQIFGCSIDEVKI